MDSIGNPFGEESTDLLTLDTKVIMSSEVIESVRSAEDVGKAQYTKFVEERITHSTKTVYDTVSRNNMKLFQIWPAQNTLQVSD